MGKRERERRDAYIGVRSSVRKRAKTMRETVRGSRIVSRKRQFISTRVAPRGAVVCHVGEQKRILIRPDARAGLLRPF